MIFMDTSNFNGAKLAILAGGQVLTLLRDNRPDIPYPGLWDLPGGGREGDETPKDCALRETFEEAGLRLSPTAITWERAYVGRNLGEVPTFFLVAEPGWLALPPLRLGDEGQEVRWMPLHGYLALDNAVPHLQERVRQFLAQKELQAWRAARSG